MIRWLLGICLALCVTGEASASGLVQEELRIAAPGLSNEPLRVRVYLPPDYAATQVRYQVLYVNDGQDMDAVAMAATLEGLYARHAITRLLVIAIDMPPDRMAGYGLFDRASSEAMAVTTRYGIVGATANTYATWLTQTLIPAIDARYRTQPTAEGRTILGWSLGALSAFGIAWQYPEVFGRVGAFSPSFWLATDTADADRVQATRIAHALVERTASRPSLDMFFAVGADEETSDRDGDGVIDVLDDTRDLVDGWTARDGTAHAGIRRRGDDANAARTTLFLLAGGRHDQASWARMLPAFLGWAYARGKTGPQID